MALGKCRECGKEASSEAKACPHCGVKNPVSSGMSRLTIIFVLILGATIFSSIIGGGKTVPPHQKPAPTPEETAEKERSSLRYSKTVMAANAVKKSMRDPESLVWESIRANEDAGTICLEYRARNGFGGMNKGHVTLVKGVPSQKVESWNRHCTAPLYDMSYIRASIK